MITKGQLIDVFSVVASGASAAKIFTAFAQNTVQDDNSLFLAVGGIIASGLTSMANSYFIRDIEKFKNLYANNQVMLNNIEDLQNDRLDQKGRTLFRIARLNREDELKIKYIALEGAILSENTERIDKILDEINEIRSLESIKNEILVNILYNKEEKINLLRERITQNQIEIQALSATNPNVRRAAQRIEQQSQQNVNNQNTAPPAAEPVHT